MDNFNTKSHGAVVETVEVGSQDETILIRQTRVRRIFSRVQSVFMALVFMSSWEAVAGNLYSVSINGGPSALTWGLIFTATGAMLQVASIAEMASVLPIAGAQYHWAWLYAPRQHRLFITWMQGWITWFAWVSVLLGLTSSTIIQLQSLIIINWHSYVLERWHTTLLIWASIVVFVGVNTLAFRIVPYLETLSGTLHVLLFLAFVIVLPAMSRHRFNNSHFVWISSVDSPTTSGWQNSFVSWNLGLLTSAWAFVGFDNAVHLGEEVKHARKTVPMVMILSIFLNALLAWLFSITLLYCMRSFDDATNAPAGMPITGITLGITDSVAVTTVLVGLNVFIGMTNIGTGITSASRLTWAWARDGGLPHSLSIVHEKYRVPIKAIFLPSVVAALLAILNIPSTLAMQVFIALGTLGLYASYIIAISCMIYARLAERHLEPGTWSMGRWGMPVNILAVAYSTYMTVWLCCPAILPLTGADMNYSLPMFVFFVSLAYALWHFRGRRHWKGVNERVVEIALKDMTFQ